MIKSVIKELLKITNGKLISEQIETKVKGICVDTRTIKKGELFIALKGKNFDGHNFIGEALKKGACGVIIDNNLFIKKVWKIAKKDKKKRVIIQVNDTVKCLGDIASYWRRKFRIPLVAITGSNGKTTTKDMAISVLSGKFKVLGTRGNFNNHIGVPLTILSLSGKDELICIEMGASSLGEIKYLSDIASPVDLGVITNIQRAHLLYFGSLSGVLKAKMELADSLSGQGTMILNIDDVHLQKAANNLRCSLLTYGINNNKADVRASSVKMHNKGVKFIISVKTKGEILKGNIDLSVFGYHNVYNALAAVAIGQLFNIPLKVCAKRLEKFKSPPLHMDILNVKGIKVINDSYNANPDSTEMAISTLDSFTCDGKKIAIIGDMLELGKYSKAAHKEVGQLIAKSNISVLFTVGKMARYIAEGAIESGLNKNRVFVSRNKQDITRKMLNIIEKGDLVLIKGSRAMKMEEILKRF